MPTNTGTLTSSASNLNLVGMGRTTAEVKHNGTLNSDRLNAYSNDGWLNGPSRLDIYKRTPLSATWNTRKLNGLQLVFGGGHEAHSENQFLGEIAGETYRVGGPSGAFVWGNKDDLSGEMISDYSAYMNVIGTMTLCGNYHFTDPTALKADSANRKEKGLVVYGKDAAGMCPPGKSTYPAGFTGICLGTAIETAITPTEDAADQLKFGRCFSHYCDTFFRSNNIQTLGCEFGQFDQLHTPYGFEYTAGGLHRCREHVLQAGCTHGLRIIGNDTRCKSVFATDRMIFDGTSAANTIGIYVKAASGGTGNKVEAKLDITPGIAGRTSNPCVWSEGSYCHFDFSGSNFLYPGFMHVQGGNAIYFPWLILQKSRFSYGSDLTHIRSLFSTASRGYVGIIFADNIEIPGGVSVSPTNWYYSPFRGVINITGDAAANYTTIQDFSA